MKRSNVTPLLYHLDDDPLLMGEIAALFGEKDRSFPIEVRSFTHSRDFLQALQSKKPDLALIDIQLSPQDLDGSAVIKELRRAAPQCLIVALSGNIEAVKRSMLAGTDDFISKLSSPEEIILRLSNLWQLRLAPTFSADHAASKKSADSTAAIGATMAKISKRIPAILESAISAVHVLGESGTGKEVVASLFETAIGQRQPFIKINCGAIAANLIERELFGHVKGAYTGATSDQIGYLEAASGGWIFLDEVAMLTPAAQTALLRVIENQEVMRVGAHQTRKIDVRVVSASNEPLDQLVQKGRFRQDLWQRLREAVIELPPLRQRRGEIKAFIQHFCVTERGGPYKMLPETEALLLSHDWAQGNVRELRNCIRAMTEKHQQKQLMPMSLPPWLWESLGPDLEDAVVPEVSAQTLQIAFDGKTSYDLMSDLLLLEMLATIRGNSKSLSLQNAATALGMPKSTLATKLRRVGERDEGLDKRIKDLFKNERTT